MAKISDYQERTTLLDDDKFIISRNGNISLVSWATMKAIFTGEADVEVPTINGSDEPEPEGEIAG